MTESRRVNRLTWWKAAWLLRRNLLLLVSLALLSISTFFYLEVEAQRAAIKRTDADAFTSGQIVTINVIIDGDEVAVTNEQGQQAVVRLLGIRSFDPVVNDPVISQVGQMGFSYLQSHCLGQRAEITLSTITKTDAEGRLLAYLSLPEAGVADVGLDLVQQGLTLVYVRYDFERQQEYLAAEQTAAANNVGLWGDRETVERAKALKRDWLDEKRREAAE